MKATSLATLILGLASLQVISAQATNKLRIPPNPCPDVFQYYKMPKKDVIYGQVKVPFKSAHYMHFKINASMIGLGLQKTMIVIQKAAANKVFEKTGTAVYNIFFPYSNIIPRITDIMYNGKVYCTGPDEPLTSKGVTQIKGSHLSTYEEIAVEGQKPLAKDEKTLHDYQAIKSNTPVLMGDLRLEAGQGVDDILTVDPHQACECEPDHGTQKINDTSKTVHILGPSEDYDLNPQHGPQYVLSSGNEPSGSGIIQLNRTVESQATGHIESSQQGGRILGDSTNSSGIIQSHQLSGNIPGDVSILSTINHQLLTTAQSNYLSTNGGKTGYIESSQSGNKLLGDDNQMIDLKAHQKQYITSNPETSTSYSTTEIQTSETSSEETDEIYPPSQLPGDSYTGNDGKGYFESTQNGNKLLGDDNQTGSLKAHQEDYIISNTETSSNPTTNILTSEVSSGEMKDIQHPDQHTVSYYSPNAPNAGTSTNTTTTILTSEVSSEETEEITPPNQYPESYYSPDAKIFNSETSTNPTTKILTSEVSSEETEEINPPNQYPESYYSPNVKSGYIDSNKSDSRLLGDQDQMGGEKSYEHEYIMYRPGTTTNTTIEVVTSEVSSEETEELYPPDQHPGDSYAQKLNPLTTTKYSQVTYWDEDSDGENQEYGPPNLGPGSNYPSNNGRGHIGSSESLDRVLGDSEEEPIKKYDNEYVIPGNESPTDPGLGVDLSTEDSSTECISTESIEEPQYEQQDILRTSSEEQQGGMTNSAQYYPPVEEPQYGPQGGFTTPPPYYPPSEEPQYDEQGGLKTPPPYYPPGEESQYYQGGEEPENYSPGEEAQYGQQGGLTNPPPYYPPGEEPQYYQGGEEPQDYSPVEEPQYGQQDGSKTPPPYYPPGEEPQYGEQGGLKTYPPYYLPGEEPVYGQRGRLTTLSPYYPPGEEPQYVQQGRLTTSPPYYPPGEEPQYYQGGEEPQNYSPEEEPQYGQQGGLINPPPYYPPGEEPQNGKQDSLKTPSPYYLPGEEPEYGQQSRLTTQPPYYPSEEEPQYYQGGEEPQKYSPGEEPQYYQEGEEPENEPPGEQPENYPDRQNYPSGEQHKYYQGGEEPQNYTPGKKPHYYHGGENPQNYPPGKKSQYYPGGEKPQNYPTGEQPQYYLGGEEPQNYPPGEDHLYTDQYNPNGEYNPTSMDDYTEDLYQHSIIYSPLYSNGYNDVNKYDVARPPPLSRPSTFSGSSYGQYPSAHAQIPELDVTGSNYVYIDRSDNPRPPHNKRPPYFSRGKNIIGPNAECGLLNPGVRYNTNEYPWVAAIMVVKNTCYEYKCSATLITNAHVLTSAKCVKDIQGENIDPEDLLVIMGAKDLRRWATNGAIVRGASKVQVHPYFRPDNSEADLAVISLVSVVNLNQDVYPACLWHIKSDLARMIGQKGIVSGWGVDASKMPVNRPFYGAISRSKELNVLHQDQCPIPGQNRNIYPISQHAICTGDTHGQDGSCIGDKGAGFTMAYDGRSFLRGIVSRTAIDSMRRCDSEHTVLTDVAQYTDWIQKACEK